MKILVIHGSMRKGYTYMLTKEIVNRLSDKPDVEITEIGVADLDLPFCISCHNCFSKGEEFCPHHNVMKNIQAALGGCDGVIVGGVTYLWALNAAMKNVLDHLGYLFHRPSLFGKKGIVVTTSAGAGEKGVAKYLKTVLGQWGINGAQIVSINARERELDPPAHQSAKLTAAAERFYGLIKSGKPISPVLNNIAVHNAFRAMSLGGFTASERDTQYWRQKDFVNKSYPVYAGALKYLAGTAVYGIVKFMSRNINRIKNR